MSTRSIGRRHRRATPQPETEQDSLRRQLAAAGGAAVQAFVRGSLPRVLRTVRPGGLSLHPSAAPELHEAAWQISNCVGQLQHAARQDLLASLEPLLGILDAQRRMIAQQQLSLTDPEKLDSAMGLDHANAMAHHGVLRALVLAGGAWPARRRRPVTLVEVARGAQCAIADFQRVEVAGDSALQVHGWVVEPLMTALAELLDNGVRACAEGEEPVHLHVGNSADGGALVSVTDAGVGMDDLALAQATALVEGRLHPASDAIPGPGTVRPAPRQPFPRIGLRTVALAATALGLHVYLRSAPGGGTRATVLLPGHLLVLPDDAPPAPAAFSPTSESLEETV
ncbi:ATP-binding protein [Kitasatospora sp. NPDC001261]|uniref:ATP-binding protein n=1 Tax=Kitasatospora sp. NPDC001261 TaxID=3364012 RepID=UPI0036B58026